MDPYLEGPAWTTVHSNLVNEIAHQLAPKLRPKYLALAEERVLVDIHVADLEGLRLGPLWPLVRRLSRDPHEVKWAGAATLLGERGRAIHERVLWR